ncbi:MAG: hypothetical protein OHK0045_17640 [Raineya sp.]
MKFSKFYTPKKIWSDLLASLIGSNVLANFIAYNVGNYEINTSLYWLLLVVFVFIFLGGLIFLRQQKIQEKNYWDFIFPISLLAFACLLLGAVFSVGDVYDKDFGKKLLDKVDSDFTRTLIDIYASAANQSLVVKPIGLLIVLATTVLSRFLGAYSTLKK